MYKIFWNCQKKSNLQIFANFLTFSEIVKISISYYFVRNAQTSKLCIQNIVIINNTLNKVAKEVSARQVFGGHFSVRSWLCFDAVYI